MRKMFLLAVAVLAAASAFSQQVSVYVRSGDVDLPFAFISVNNRSRGMTDTLGVARIAKADIEVGDTIRANYVGQQAVKIYDGSERVDLTIDALEISGVTVFGRDKFKYWKHIRLPWIPGLYQTMYGRFEITEAGSPAKMAGTGRYTRVPREKTPEDDFPYEVKDSLIFTTLDTLASENFMTRGLYGKWIVNNVSITIGFGSAWQNQDLRVVREQTGDESVNVFSIIRPALQSPNDRKIVGGATRLYVDAATKRIVRASGFIESVDKTMSFDAAYALSGGRTHPTDITAKIVYKNGSPETHYRFSEMKVAKPDKKSFEGVKE